MTADRARGALSVLQDADGKFLCEVPCGYISQLGRTRHIFTITFMGKRKSASCAGGYGSRTTTGTPPIPRHSLQW